MAKSLRRSVLLYVVIAFVSFLIAMAYRMRGAIASTAAEALFTRAEPTPGLDTRYTPQSLWKYRQDSPVLLVAVCGQVYEVTSARARYGPGGSYANMAGRDITLSLAHYTIPREDDPIGQCPVVDPVLSTRQKESLDGWRALFDAKYPVVGSIVCENVQTF